MRRKTLIAQIAACLLLVPMIAAAADYHPQVVSHRGASAYLPEQTLEAYAFAYATGADVLENDVIMSKDGVLMVMHDIFLDTCTNVAEVFPDRKRADGRYYCTDFTFAELRTLRVHERVKPGTDTPAWPGRFPNYPIDYKIPTLDELVLQTKGLNQSTGGDTAILVEVKEPYFFRQEGKDIMKATVDALTRLGYNKSGSRILLQSFDYESVVRASRDLGWKGELGMLVTAAGGQVKTDESARHKWLTTPEGVKDIARYATFYAPNFNLLAVPTADGNGYQISDLCKEARAAGMKVYAWTMRRDSLPKGFKSFDEALNAGTSMMKLDGLISDFPDVVIEYLRKNGMR